MVLMMAAAPAKAPTPMRLSAFPLVFATRLLLFALVSLLGFGFGALGLKWRLDDLDALRQIVQLGRSRTN